tara:strand:- start:2419 stop:3249 length:831 start_codon:yes stop_codon:yes gene_type:complete
VLLNGCFAKKSIEKISRPGTTDVTSSSREAKWSTGVLSSGIDIKISSDFNPLFDVADNDGSGHNLFIQMMKQWNSSTNLYTFFQADGDTTTNKNYTNISSYYDSEMGIYKSTNWFSNVSNQALAVTQFYGIRRNVGSATEYIELTHADIILNYRDYTFSMDSSSNSNYDLPSVLLHELGHFIGLSHQSDFLVSSVMQPYLSIFDVNRSITSADISSTRTNYNASLLTASNALSALNTGVRTSPVDPKEGEIVRGIIELRDNGKCHHYENGVLSDIH